jgi:hypothetical protein
MRRRSEKDELGIVSHDEAEHVAVDDGIYDQSSSFAKQGTTGGRVRIRRN